MKRQLLVLTEIIAPYRIPVFNALAQHPEIDLRVIFLAETDPSIRQWRIYSDEIQFSYEVLPSWRTRLGKYNLLLNQKVADRLRTLHPDVIVCGGYNYLASWQALRWARRNGVPFLLWCESTDKDHRAGHSLVESLKKNFFDICDGFIVPGTSAREYVSRMGAAAERIFAAPNAVDNYLFAFAAKSARMNALRVRGELDLPSRYFLFVGRLVRTKGVFDLLEAYRGLNENIRSQIGLIFAGEGPLRAELDAMARTIYPGSVRFPGFVQRDELASYYGLAECLVFPTHSDPWGLVVNEAMACGLPVICGHAAGCAADLIRSNGRLVAARNVFQLASAMQEIASDTALRLKMSHESAKIIQLYSPELCAAGIAEAALSCRACLNEEAGQHTAFNRPSSVSRTSSTRPAFD
jgi:glycosyltransferase involved in cell wall biosynthesis